MEPLVVPNPIIWKNVRINKLLKSHLDQRFQIYRWTIMACLGLDLTTPAGLGRCSGSRLFGGGAFLGQHLHACVNSVSMCSPALAGAALCAPLPMGDFLLVPFARSATMERRWSDNMEQASSDNTPFLSLHYLHSVPLAV